MKNISALVISMVVSGCASLFSTPLCPVSGEGLKSMGEPFAFEHKGTKVELCCEGCKEDFDADPEKYLAVIRGEKPYPKISE